MEVKKRLDWKSRLSVLLKLITTLTMNFLAFEDRKGNSEVLPEVVVHRPSGRHY